MNEEMRWYLIGYAVPAVIAVLIAMHHLPAMGFRVFWQKPSFSKQLIDSLHPEHSTVSYRIREVLCIVTILAGTAALWPLFLVSTLYGLLKAKSTSHGINE